MVKSKWFKILDVIHPDLANVSKAKLTELIAKKNKVDARSNLHISTPFSLQFKNYNNNHISFLQKILQISQK